jgi:chemotaxis protein MotB
MVLKHRLLPLLLVALVASCVPKGKYDDAIHDAETAHNQAQMCDTQSAAQRAEIARLNEALSGAQALADQRDRALTAASAALTGATTSSKDLQAKLDEATAENAQLRKELDRLGKNADKLLGEKGTLATALDQARARLDELRKAQAAADARAALFKQLALKFQKMIDSGELKIVLRDGRMVLQLSNDVLFDSGQTDIKPGGQTALKEVATVFKTLGGRRFQVAGHTDNVPIKTERFASNWELSTARAVQVTRFLVAQGVKPEVLSAAGYGEFDPVAGNADGAGRAKNRRIEITLQPNIDELVAVPK